MTVNVLALERPLEHLMEDDDQPSSPTCGLDAVTQFGGCRVFEMKELV